MEWRAKGEATPVKAKTRLSAGKVLMTVFWDAKGVVYVDFLLERRTINAAYYSELLGKVREAYRSKRRKIPIRSVLILHDNARPHTAAATQAKLEELHWTALDHPPYSPDLSPCNYHLFGPLKKDLGGKKFSSEKEVQDFVRVWLLTRPTSFYEEGIKKTASAMKKCVDNSGSYVEK